MKNALTVFLLMSAGVVLSAPPAHATYCAVIHATTVGGVPVLDESRVCVPV